MILNMTKTVITLNNPNNPKSMILNNPNNPNNPKLGLITLN